MVFRIKNCLSDPVPQGLRKKQEHLRKQVFAMLLFIFSAAEQLPVDI